MRSMGPHLASRRRVGEPGEPDAPCPRRDDRSSAGAGAGTRHATGARLPGRTAVPSSPLPGLPACILAEKVVGSLWSAARFPERGLGGLPRFRPGNGARQAFSREEPTGPTITLSARYRTKGVVLHELVHWALAATPELAHHGSTFARVLVDATSGVLRPGAGRRARRRLPGGAGAHRRATAAGEGRLVYGADEQRRLAQRRGTGLDTDGLTPSVDAAQLGAVARRVAR